MRLSSFLTTFLAAVLISACGGGGGSPGQSSVIGSSFAVVAPPTLTLQAGLWQSFAVRGGVKPYSVFSTDPAVVSGWFIGDDVVAVGAVVPGKATVTVTDAKGSKFDIALTSGSSTALFTTAAAAITITPGLAYAQTYVVGGGTPPYTVSNSLSSAVTATIDGRLLTITGLQISTVAATLTIKDAAGATLTLAVTPGTVPLAVNPTTSTILIGSTLRSVITGGTPPYRTINSLDNCVTNVQIISGNILQATGNKACDGSVVTVIDANNQTVSPAVTVTAGTSSLQFAPSVLSVPENSNTPSLSLLVYGATGTLRVFSDNTTMLIPQTPVSNGDGTYTVTLTGGDTCSAVVKAAVVGVDKTVPPNGTFTDKKGVPDNTVQPEDDVAPSPKSGGDRSITITVVDPLGRQGTSTVTVKDINGAAGC